MMDLGYNASQALARLTEADTKHKGNQVGSVRFRSGSWYIKFSEWKLKNGEWVWGDSERKIEDGGQKLTEKRALMLGYEQHVSKANQLNKAPQGMMTLEFFVTARFQPDCVATYGRSWKASTNSLLAAHILPAFGKLQLNEIRRQMVQQFIHEKSAKYSYQTVKHIVKILAAIYRHAQSLDFEVINPAELVKLPRSTYKERTAYTIEQIRQLAAKLRERNQEELARFALFLSLSGMRRGEALAMRWRDVEFGGFMRVTGTYDLKEFTPGKSKAARRPVPTNPEIDEILKQQLAMSKWNGADHHVWAARNGRPMNAANALRRFVKPLAVELGMPEFDWHSERHTSITTTSGQMSSDDRRAIYGHSSDDMTARYTHLELERVKEAFIKATEKPN